jgi:hypothetical protein
LVDGVEEGSPSDPITVSFGECVFGAAVTDAGGVGSIEKILDFSFAGRGTIRKCRGVCAENWARINDVSCESKSW